ncbi:MAG TPA: hypothetical protein VFU98_12665 [Microlunatus sp.]|nr:hypothetical protein [Microlunatus sp.]
MTPEDEPTSTDETAEDQRQTPGNDTDRVDPDGDADQELPATARAGDAGLDGTEDHPASSRDAPAADPDTVAVDTSHLDRAQEAIDDAREAVKKVAATDSIEDQATGAGDLPAFADATDDAEQPRPPEDDTAPSADDTSTDDAGGARTS